MHELSIHNIPHALKAIWANKPRQEKKAVLTPSGDGDLELELSRFPIKHEVADIIVSARVTESNTCRKF